MGGPKGGVEGVNVMLEWIDRAQISLKPVRYFAEDKIIIAEEQAEWHFPETGMTTQTVASVFEIENNFIVSVHRYEDLNKAFEMIGLKMIGLNEKHLVK